MYRTLSSHVVSCFFEGLGGTMEIERHRGLPGGRAVLGGVLWRLAAVGVFVAYDQAGADPTDPIVVAAGAIRVGEVLEPGDLRTVDADLPASAAAGTFDAVDGLVGRVALGPIAEGEVVQAGSVSDQRATAEVHEVAVSLPRGQIAVGRLKAGERVDVFVTYDDAHHHRRPRRGGGGDRRRRRWLAHERS